MPIPTNLDALTAIDLGTLPATIVQVVNDGATVYDVWYKYTAGAREKVIGVFAFDGFADMSGFRPKTTVYIGPAAAPVRWFSSVAYNLANRAIEVPVVPGTTYYFKFAKSTNAIPATLTLAVETAPKLTIPAGTIFIDDAVGGCPGAFFSPIDGSVRNFVYPFANGDTGDVLSSGRVLVSDEAAGVANLKLYDAQLNYLAAVPFVYTGLPKIRTCNAGGKWFVGASTSVSVRTVLSDGSFGPTTWTLPSGMRCLAANNAETILYYNAAIGAGVARWNLTTDTALADLAAAVANTRNIDMLVLGDDTLLVSYFTQSGAKSLFVRRYNAAGSVLNTYTLGNADMENSLPRLAYAIDDPSSFWVFLFPKTPFGVSAFENVRISDGAILTSVTSTQYGGGDYVPAVTATPLDRFGNSNSCPLIILRAAINEDNTDGTGGGPGNPTIFVGETGPGAGCPISLDPGADGGATAGCLPSLSPGSDGGSTAGCAAVL